MNIYSRKFVTQRSEGISTFVRILSILCLVVTCSSSWAQTADRLPVIRIGYSGLGPMRTLLKVMEQGNIWQRHGLDVKPVYFVSGNLQGLAMLSGEIMFTYGDIPSQINLAVAGALDVKVLAVLINRLDHFFVVREAIQNPTNLKGKSVAIARLGSSSDTITRMVLGFWNLKPDKEVTILQYGNTPNRMGALITGHVDGALLSPEVIRKVMGTGCCRVLADLSELPLPYAQFGLTTTLTIIEKNPRIVEQLLVALVDGIHYFKSRPDVAVGVYQREMGVKEVVEAKNLHARLSTGLLDYPLPESRGLQAVLDSLSHPNAKGFQIDNVTNKSFLEKIKASGYIDRLYGRAASKAAD
jgi:ABC-type nitrate/sulfonate/bicarbonate transport system substrate-binding protein